MPDVSLKRAREKRDDARRSVAHGIDPGAKRGAEHDAEINTFVAAADEWLLTRRTHSLPPRPHRHLVIQFSNNGTTCRRTNILMS
ncbi:MAG: Arm DNA-binding domain-containing protein [Steroidobacteraceae bacterium]